MIVVLMGVTGAGKTTVGTILADRMGTAFADADDHHPPENKEKMRAGRPLDDGDRAPWLAALNGVLRDWHRAGAGGVMACSALKAAYRDRLRAGIPAADMHFVLLDGAADMIAGRLAARHHEYMNPALLDSQMKTLERPRDALVVTNDRTPEEVADLIFTRLPVRHGPG